MFADLIFYYYFCSAALAAICFSSWTTAQTLPPSNLPSALPGVFEARGTALIDAPIEDVWSILLDFPAYPAWNPFVR